MKNIKLTIATTLSMIALTFAGTAAADGDRNYNSFERSVNKTSVKANSNHYAKSRIRNVNKRVTSKRIVVKNTPTKKVIITKTMIQKPVTHFYSKTKQFAHVKRFNKQYNRYQKRMNDENGYKQKRVQKQSVYTVRPGDTLIQVSYKTGVSIYKLARLNRIKHKDLNYLYIGQKLRLV